MNDVVALTQLTALQMIDIGSNAIDSLRIIGSGIVRLRIFPIRNTSSRGSNGLAR